MRVLFGIVLGVALTIGGAYAYDSSHAATGTPTIAQRPLVNWDVVAVKWHELAARARAEWRHLAKAS